MKTLFVLICLAAISSLSSSAAIGHAANVMSMDRAIGAVALDAPATSSRHTRSKQTTLHAQSNLKALRGTVVSEMRATKAFVKENVVKEESADRGLMLLAAVGMIVLQLRRKHKSLPQRQIAPYA
jgi:hypothetical protein